MTLNLKCISGMILPEKCQDCNEKPHDICGFCDVHCLAGDLRI